MIYMMWREENIWNVSVLVKYTFPIFFLLLFIIFYYYCCSYNEELHILYSSPNIIRQIKSRRMRWAGHVVRVGEEWEVYKILMGKPEGKRPLGRPRRRWEDGIRIDLRDTGCGYGVDPVDSG
jgi:hypothetical protein